MPEGELIVKLGLDVAQNISQEKNVTLSFTLKTSSLSTSTAANKLSDFIPEKAYFHLANYPLHSDPFISEFNN